MRKRTRAAETAVKPPDIRMVADKAKVSVATVSRVVNGSTTVGDKLAKRVWSAVERLNYVPNRQARALVSGRSRLIGVIISDMTNPFFPELMQGFEEAAVEMGYEILLASTSYDEQRKVRSVQRMMERKVDGVAVMTFGIEEPLLEQLAERGVPMVFVDQAPQRDSALALHVDYKQGLREAVEHLLELGHTRIGFVAGPPAQRSAYLRLQAFEAALSGAGQSVAKELIYEGDHTFERGIEAAESLLGAKKRPTAIVCSNDVTAIGVMHGAARLGLNVPADVSVIGFDDIFLAHYLLPPLTTVQMSSKDLARKACTVLGRRMDGSMGEAPRAKTQTTRLIVRGTTAAPAGKNRPAGK